MRFTKLAAVVGTVAAMVLGTAATSSAAEPPPAQYKPIKSNAPKKKQQKQQRSGASVQTTGGAGTFMEINSAGELRHWVPNGSGSFTMQVRGTGWGGTRAITSLSDDVFLEIKPDYRLALWEWKNGFYQQTIIGIGWDPTRLITGITYNRDFRQFLEINKANELVRWSLDGNNGLSREVIGTGWVDSKLLAGLDGPPLNTDFLEIETNGYTAEWIDIGTGLQEYPFQGVNFSNVRIIAGLDLEHFVYVDNNNGNLVAYDYNWDQGAYVPRVAGTGWQPARLIG